MKTKMTGVCVLLFFLVIGVTSCEKKKGCMDIDSVNYDGDAQVSDGGCRYNCEVVFWWKQALTTTCQSAGISTINISVDGKFIGSASVGASYFSSAPDCGTNNAVTCTVDLLTAKSKSISVSFDLIDGNGNVVDTVNETATVNCNMCNTYEVK